MAKRPTPRKAAKQGDDESLADVQRKQLPAYCDELQKSLAAVKSGNVNSALYAWQHCPDELDGVCKLPFDPTGYGMLAENLLDRLHTASVQLLAATAERFGIDSTSIIERQSNATTTLARVMLRVEAERPKNAAPVTTPDASLFGKGIASRNAWFLQQYEARGSDTFHKPAEVHAKWEAMTATERAAICPDSPNKIAKGTVDSGIKRARYERNGKTAKPQRKPQKKI